MIVEEGWPHGGVGANLAALIQEQAFDHLDAPIARVTGADLPMPYSKPLEQIAFPHEPQIVERLAIRRSSNRDRGPGTFTTAGGPGSRVEDSPLNPRSRTTCGQSPCWGRRPSPSSPPARWPPPACSAPRIARPPDHARPPSADNTDVYAFTAPDAPGKLTVVSNWIPLQEPGGRPVLRQARSEGALLRQDRQHGDGVEDVAYRWQFPTSSATRTRSCTRSRRSTRQRPEPQLRPDLRPLLRDLRPQREGRLDDYTGRSRNVPVAPDNVGPEDDAELRKVPTGAIARCRGGGKTFVGPADDPFFVDLGAVFDGINIDKPGPPGDRARQPGRRQGRRLGLQHALVRAAGAGVRGHARRPSVKSASGSTPSSACGRRPSAAASIKVKRGKGAKDASGCRSAASATR